MNLPPDNLADLFIGKLGPILFRVAWWNHLDPSKRDSFKQDFADAVLVGALKSYEVHSNQPIPRTEFMKVKVVARPLLDRLIQERYSSGLEDLIPTYQEETFEHIVKRMTQKEQSSEVHRLMAE